MHQTIRAVRLPGFIRAAVTASAVVLSLLPGTVSAQASSPDEELAWFAAGTALAGALMLDEVVQREWAASDGQIHMLSHIGDVLGRGRLMVAGVGGVYGLAKLSGDDALAGSAGRVFLALSAAGAVNGVLKFGVGRLRPGADEGSAEYSPLNLDNRWQSFPSGHVVAAFALATAISEEAGRPWVTGLGYGAASLVAWSRIHEDKHWASDVVAGAIVGTLTSRTVTRSLRRRAARREAARKVRVSVSPSGLLVSISTR